MELKLTVKDGSFWYRSDRVLFRHLNFSVQSGQICAVLGPNGVGKTTFLRCLMGLLPWKEGATLLNGTSLAEIHRKDFWRNIAYVPQARVLPFAFSVMDVVLMGRSVHVSSFAQPSRNDMDIAMHSLERMGVSHLAARRFGELSGGEAQMVFISRALAAEPKLIILDEPESHLDFRNQLVILQALSDLAKQDGIACIVNTHFPEHALRIADHSLVLGHGALGHRYGATSEMMNEDTLRNFFGVRVRHLSFEDSGCSYRSIYPLVPVGSL